MIQTSAGNYALFDSEAGGAGSVQGVPNFDPLPIGHPSWYMFDFFATTPVQNTFMGGLSRWGNPQSYRLVQWSFGNVQPNNGVSGAGGQPVTDNQWHRALMCFDSRTSRTLYIDGIAGETQTGDEVWYGMTAIAVGVRLYNGGDADLAFVGNLANWGMGRAPPSSAQRSGCVLGVNPLSYPGCFWNCPLKNNANDVFGVMNLTLVGDPNITPVGHPPVDKWPPTGGGGGNAGGTVVRPHQLRRMRI